MNGLKQIATRNSKKQLAKTVSDQVRALNHVEERVAAHTRDCSKVIAYLEKELLTIKPDIVLPEGMREFIDNLHRAAWGGQ